jgi:hypothetical protein
MLGNCTSFNHALADFVRSGIRICNDCGPILLRASWKNPRKRYVSGRAQELTEFYRPVDVEQHQFAAVRRQAGINCGNDGICADGKVHNGLKGKEGRQLNQLPLAGILRKLRLQGVC